MAQVSVKYNPYRMDTQIVVNGSEISDDNLLQYVKGKRLQEWVSGFPEQLADALNSGSFDVEFCGTALDYDDFLEAFKQAGRDKVVRMVNISFKEGKTDTDINQKIVDVFTKLQEGPVDEFRDPQLKKAFDNINSAVFPINIIGTMSAGKSTLINALLGRKLMPAQNGACTDKITEILDNDNDQFHALVYDADNQVLEEYHDLTYEIMVELNKKENVRGIRAEGDIPFLTADDTALKLIDTPGTNNSENRKHRNTTYRALENSSNSLVIYILNSTQLETDDDNMLLNYVAEQIRKGGKRVRDRFLFVINKIDAVNPDEGENPQKMMQAVVEYLARHGIENPQIFPCSAIAALVLETELKDVQFDTLSREEKKALSASAKKAIPVLELFNDEDCMHMEKYTTLCPSAQSELEYRLQKAEADEDANEQALIHSGICSLEAAITAYVKKYAKTKKIKDLVESFEQILDSTQVLTKAKSQVAADEAVAKACAERAAAVRAKIDGGEEAQAFKKKVAAIDPVPEIEKAAKEKQAQIIEKITMLFSPYGKMIRDKEIAQGLIHQFANESTELIAQMTVDLEFLSSSSIWCHPVISSDIWFPLCKGKIHASTNNNLKYPRFFDAFSLYSVFSVWTAQMEIGGMFRRDAGQNAPLLRHKTKGKSRIMNQNHAKEYYKKLFVNYPDVLSVEEATTLLGFKSQTAIIRRIHQHRIRCLKVGRSFMIPKEYLIDYLLDS